jgi:hypothetical protein
MGSTIRSRHPTTTNDRIPAESTFSNDLRVFHDRRCRDAFEAPLMRNAGYGARQKWQPRHIAAGRVTIDRPPVWEKRTSPRVIQHSKSSSDYLHRTVDLEQQPLLLTIVSSWPSASARVFRD